MSTSITKNAASLFFFLLIPCTVFAEAVGDVTGDGVVDLQEAIYALQVSSGMDVSPQVSATSYTGLTPVNVNNTDNTIGLNPGSDFGDLMTWDGNNWIAAPPPGGGATGSTYRDNMQPFQVVNYIIALTGTYPVRSSINDPTIGEITLFAGNFAPRDWAFCNGQLLSISGNEALFSVIGMSYGGNGTTTFALPDLRGRVPVHSGTGTGLTPRVLGQRGGQETVIDSY